MARSRFSGRDIDADNIFEDGNHVLLDVADAWIPIQEFRRWKSFPPKRRRRLKYPLATESSSKNVHRLQGRRCRYEDVEFDSIATERSMSVDTRMRIISNQWKLGFQKRWHNFSRDVDADRTEAC